MKIYLDVSCLNRAFDDQHQPRIRLEAEAIAMIFERIDARRWEQVASEMAEIEVEAIRDPERRRRVWALLPGPEDRMRLTLEVFRRASALTRLGFAAADATHIAGAEVGGADVLLSCDDKW